MVISIISIQTNRLSFSFNPSTLLLLLINVIAGHINMVQFATDTKAKVSPRSGNKPKTRFAEDNTDNNTSSSSIKTSKFAEPTKPSSNLYEAPSHSAMARDGNIELKGTKLSQINKLSSKEVLEKSESNSTKTAGLNLVCHQKSNIIVDTSCVSSGRLKIIINSNMYTLAQTLLLTGCLPTCLGVLSNNIGSIDELVFEYLDDMTYEVTMSRTRRKFLSVSQDEKVTVQSIGVLDESSPTEEIDVRKDLGEEISDNSTSEPRSVDDNHKKWKDNLVVVDGQSGEKIKEDRFVINGKKMITGALQHASADEEGDVSTLVKAFCRLPLTYEEFAWIEEHAVALLPEDSSMGIEEKKGFKIQKLQLELRKIQMAQEKQALGQLLTDKDLHMMTTMNKISDDLFMLKYDFTDEELEGIKQVAVDSSESESSSSSESEDESFTEMGTELSELAAFGSKPPIMVFQEIEEEEEEEDEPMVVKDVTADMEGMTSDNYGV